jgi:HK97 gp10 family phage protein
LNFRATATALPVRTSVAVAKIKAAVQLSVEQACQIITEEAQAIVPVRTGALRDSIGWSTEEQGQKIIGTVSAKMPYAGFVEWGTGRRGAESAGAGPYSYTMSWPGMAAQPYMRPSVDAARAAVKGVFVDNVRLALR